MNFNLIFKYFTVFMLVVCSVNIFAQEYDVAWSKLKGVTSDASGTLTKTDANGWNNTSALSDNKLKKNKDGYVKYVIEDVSNNRIIGLTSRNNSTNYQEIDYAVAILGSRAFILESGRVKGYLGRVDISDEIKIAREGSRIVYYKNSSISRRTNTDPEFKLFVDISLYNQNASLTGVVASFAIQIKIDFAVTDADCEGSGLGLIDATITGGVPPYTFSWDNGTITEDLVNVLPGQYKLTITDAVGYENTKKAGIYSNIIWDELDGMTNNAGNLSKSASGNQWNTSAITTNLLSSETDGRIEYVIDNKNTQRAFGFSASLEGQGYTNIDYCVVLSNNKKMYVVENGSVKSITKYKIDDVVSIFRDGNKIKYKLNNDLVYKTTVDPTEELFLLASIRTPNASINGLKVDFCPIYDNPIVFDFADFSNSEVQISYNGYMHNVLPSSTKKVDLTQDDLELQIVFLGNSSEENLFVYFSMDSTFDIVDYYGAILENGVEEKFYFDEIFFRETVSGIKFYDTEIEGDFNLMEEVESVNLNMQQGYLLTPNGDGLNDVLKIQIPESYNASEVIMTIKTLQNEVLFTSIDETSEWNCTDSLGNVVLIGTYIFEITIDGVQFDGKFNVEY